MNIGVAFSFRHNPEKEGRLKCLSVVSTRLEGVKAKLNGRDLPVLGYVCAFDGADFSWDGGWFRTPVFYGDGRPPQNASLKTARTCVCECGCQGGPQPFPAGVFGKNAEDGSEQECPLCGSTATIHDLVPGSDEFFEFVGDLRGPLESAAQAAYSGGVPFLFPSVWYSTKEYGQISVTYTKHLLGLSRDETTRPANRNDAFQLLSRVDPTGDTGQDRANRLCAVLDEAAANGSSEIPGTGVRVSVTPASDQSVPREVALSAAWLGHVLRDMTSATLEEIQRCRYVGYYCDPAITSGVVDSDCARSKTGVSFGGGAIDEVLRLSRQGHRRETLIARY